MKIKFEKVLGSKIDGRGGQLFWAIYRPRGKLFPSYNLLSFYVRADDGLRDCWGEFGLNSAECKNFLEEIISGITLPVFDVSFEYLKKRVKDGIDYKNQHKLFLPPEFDECSSILEYEAKDDLQWKNSPFSSKTMKDYELDIPKNNLIDKIDRITGSLFPEMLKLGWGFNDEDMDKELPIISKISYNPLQVFAKNKTAPDLLDPKTKKQASNLNIILKRLIEKMVGDALVREWKERTKEASYFCFNVGEKKTAELLHIISLSFEMVPLKVETKQHPFLQALMLISIVATLRRKGFICECGCGNMLRSGSEHSDGL